MEQLYSYIVLDGNKYAVVSNTYVRNWQRFFTTVPVANLIRLNYVDRGPGMKTYTMSLALANWSTDSIPYKNGITQTALEQMTNLETSYLKIASPLAFLDAFGQPPSLQTGVYFTDMIQRVPNYATNEEVFILVDVTFIEASGFTI